MRPLFVHHQEILVIHLKAARRRAAGDVTGLLRLSCCASLVVRAVDGLGRTRGPWAGGVGQATTASWTTPREREGEGGEARGRAGTEGLVESWIKIWRPRKGVGVEEFGSGRIQGVERSGGAYYSTLAAALRFSNLLPALVPFPPPQHRAPKEKEESMRERKSIPSSLNPICDHSPSPARARLATSHRSSPCSQSAAVPVRWHPHRHDWRRPLEASLQRG